MARNSFLSSSLFHVVVYRKNQYFGYDVVSFTAAVSPEYNLHNSHRIVRVISVLENNQSKLSSIVTVQFPSYTKTTLTN